MLNTSYFSCINNSVETEQEEKKPPHERRETPKTPPGLEESVQKHGKATKNAIDALNRAAAEQFNQTVSAQSEFTVSHR
jgi:hypothetical protein